MAIARMPFEGALLGGAFGAQDGVAYVGGLSRQLFRLNWATMQSSIVGTHDDAIKAIARCQQTGMLGRLVGRSERLGLTHMALLGLTFTGSWDCTAAAWDGNGRVARMPLPGKVYSMDCVGNHLVVAMSDRLINVYDTRRIDEPIQRRESSLKYQTRCVRISPDNQGYVCSSIEGRVAVEYFGSSPEVQAKKYAFKCHRRALAPPTGAPFDVLGGGRAEAQEGAAITEVVYPVNAVAFHPTLGTFCTGASDGVVSVWDAAHRKRIRNYPRTPASVACLAFNRRGSLLAIASSYCYEEGEKEYAGERPRLHLQSRTLTHTF